MLGTASRWAPTAEQDLDREIEVIIVELRRGGTLRRDDLADRVGARYWGPGRFVAALHEAVDEHQVQELPQHRYGPAESDPAPAPR